MKRRTVVLVVRLTPKEKAIVAKQQHADETLSECVRRLLLRVCR